MTMFYYYTGNNFYEMIQYKGFNILRPNVFDEYDDSLSSSSVQHQQSEQYTKINKKTYDEKMWFLNKKNLNIKKPYFTYQNQTQFDLLTTNTHFQKCILTSSFEGEKNNNNDYIIGNSSQDPVIDLDDSNKNINILPNKLCNGNGMDETADIYKYSNHLKKSCNLQLDRTINNSVFEEQQQSNYQQNLQNNSNVFVQTNFSQIWVKDNRRHLVSLSIIFSIMNVCIQKITNSLIEIRPDTLFKENKIFNCTTENTENNISDEDDDDNDDYYNNSENINKNINEKKNFYTQYKNDIKKQYIKIKKPTIEVLFQKKSSKSSDLFNSFTTGINYSNNKKTSMQFSV